MEKNLKEALKHRRSYYEIEAKTPVSDEEITDMIRLAVETTPSAFNSQSARLVLLLGEQHKKLWQIVRDVLQKIVAVHAFEATSRKIEKSFASGYGTVLFFEDRTTVESLQKAYPSYRDKFPEWSEHTSAMHQFVVWTLLENVGFGASLQHYNPLIDQAVAAEWRLPESWRLVAQIPFGMPLSFPEKKEMRPVEERMKVFK